MKHYLVFLVVSVLSAVGAPQPGYITNLPPESTEARAARHQKIGQRRSGPVVMVHRGASAVAPENTLEAYAAAMDYGADGCEVDIRRTADGVLVCFHDDMLDHLTDGFGTVSQITYYELLSLSPRYRYGRATKKTRAPTLAAVLTLARQRAMLLHLDVKESGLDEDIARLLESADMWDHVAALNTQTATNLLAHPKIKLLKYKIGLYEGRRDLDPASVRAHLPDAGWMIIVDDPRVVALELRREFIPPVPLPKRLEMPWPAAFAEVRTGGTNVIAPAHLRTLSKHADSPTDLIALLHTNGLANDATPDGDASYQRRRTERILERAWAAQRLGQIHPRTRALVELLEHHVRYPSLHRDWMFHGLDGAMAARALGTLGAVESAPVIVEAFRRVRPELAQVASPLTKTYPLAWTDWRKSYLLEELGHLRCESSKRFLFEYAGAEEGTVREWASPQYEEATRALLKQALSARELEMLLRSTNLAVRGTALLECVDHPTRERTAALKNAAAWALPLPRAR